MIYSVILSESFVLKGYELEIWLKLCLDLNRLKLVIFILKNTNNFSNLGETIEVLSEPDSLGWCTGKKNGVV